MQQRYRAALLAVLSVALGVFATIAVWPAFAGDGGAETSDAAGLPSACENFVEATRLFAEHGSSAAVTMSGGEVFTGDTGARRYETLEALLDACDAELSATMPR